MENVIEVSNLSKRFKDVQAVKSLNVNVYRGNVFGFLGPNGAGKSTTIRMLLSLINPDEGSIRIFGQSLKHHRKEILSRIGAIVEKPDFYGYLSAYKNLEILGRISGHEITKKRIMEILEVVGLSKRYKSKVKTFSHGMKQRLGLAQALLHDPELIILDEPTTGLDPQGMKEIRDLIIFLSREKNKTVFLSSHILHEVELVADRMIIINKGSAQVEGYVKDLLDANSLKVSVEVDDIEKTKTLLNESMWGAKVDTLVNSKIILNLQPGESQMLNRFLNENGIGVSALVPTRSLEEFFLSITEKEGK